MRLYNILIGILGCFLLVNCDLDELPKSTASNQAIFESESGLELYTNSFYELLPSTDVGVFMIDDNSDLIARDGVSTYLLPNALSPITSSGWSWSDLRNINYFLEHAQESPVPNKEHYLGLARFFRAYFYFDKVKRFGDVPWIDRIIDVDDDDVHYGERTDRFQIMEHVLNDLDYAIENITRDSDPTSTRITKNVARAFKTRVCLFEGSFRKYHEQYGKQDSAEEWFREVVKTANEVEGFSLRLGENAYRELFLQENPFTDETILAVRLNADLQLFSSRNRRTISPTYGNRPSFTRHFVNTYLNIDGTRFTDDPEYKTKTFVEEVKNRDPRLKQTIRTTDYFRTENGIPVTAPPNFSQTYTGYQIIKGCYDERFPYDDESRKENAHLIFRYAEVLLNKAEAFVELVKINDTEWANTIGALRSSAGIQGTAIMTMPTEVDPYLKSVYNDKFNDPIMLEVLRERAVEMILEGLRPDDLIRWKLGELYETAPMNGMYVPELGEYDLNEDGVMDVCFYIGERPSDATASVFVDISESGVGKQHLSEGDHGEIIWNPGEREWLDKKYFYPIPEPDRIKNPNLGQNPGWE